METFQDYLTVANMISVAVGAVSLAIVFVLHVKSEGRTSPIAAGAFVVFGPMLGVVFTTWQAAREANWRETMDQISNAFTDAPDLKQLGLRVICMGLAAAAAVASGTAFVKRGEWFNHLRRVK